MTSQRSQSQIGSSSSAEMLVPLEKYLGIAPEPLPARIRDLFIPSSHPRGRSTKFPPCIRGETLDCTYHVSNPSYEKPTHVENDIPSCYTINQSDFDPERLIRGKNFGCMLKPLDMLLDRCYQVDTKYANCRMYDKQSDTVIPLFARGSVELSSFQVERYEPSQFKLFENAVYEKIVIAHYLRTYDPERPERTEWNREHMQRHLPSLRFWITLEYTKASTWRGLYRCWDLIDEGYYRQMAAKIREMVMHNAEPRIVVYFAENQSQHLKAILAEMDANPADLESHEHPQPEVMRDTRQRNGINHEEMPEQSVTLRSIRVARANNDSSDHGTITQGTWTIRNPLRAVAEQAPNQLGGYPRITSCTARQERMRIRQASMAPSADSTQDTSRPSIWARSAIASVPSASSVNNTQAATASASNPPPVTFPWNTDSNLPPYLLLPDMRQNLRTNLGSSDQQHISPQRGLAVNNDAAGPESDSYDARWISAHREPHPTAQPESHPAAQQNGLSAGNSGPNPPPSTNPWIAPWRRNASSRR